MKKGIKKWLPFIGIGLVIVSLAYSLTQLDKSQFNFSKAFGTKANITIDVTTKQGLIDPHWQNLAQGGEESFLRFTEFETAIKYLQPKYIRIDHIYDFYEPIQKNSNGLTYDWTKLDQAVDQILATGASPFISLSYMPPAIASSDITGPPSDWNEWTQTVRATIEHLSGKNQKNLKNVIYEVWNEPDLFGNWKLYGERDYRLLYRYAALGAQGAKNVNSFKIGGPAVTAPYKNWIDNFLGYVSDNKLRLDFYSWHRYTTDPVDYLKDLDNVDTWLFKNAGYSLEKYLTEWGPKSDNSSLNDGIYAAAHCVATSRLLLGRADKTFAFEIYDGPSPDKNKYWGRWGLLTHPDAGPVEKKPRYYALNLLNQMRGDRLLLQGEGSWVTGFAVQDGNKYKIMLTNLDIQGRNLETVPVRLIGVTDGAYNFKEIYLVGADKRTEISAVNGVLEKQIPLSANNIVLVEITPK